jgi:hypothetical protein
MGLAPGLPAQEIGSPVADLRCVDIRSLERRLSDFGKHDALVLFFVTKDCPMVGRLLPKVGRLAAEFAPRGVLFVAVNVGPGDSVRDMGTQAITHAQPYPFVKDEDFGMLKALGVERTTTAVVLDSERVLRYRGRVDDQVRYAHVKDAPAREDLRLALTAVLAGADVEVSETPVDGCKVGAPPVPPPSGRHTFHRDVEPLIQRHCQDCHREGGAAPFPLLGYDDVADHAEMIGEVVRRQRMPPWHASDAHGSFRNRRGLASDERALIDDWLRSGRVRGEREDAPPPRDFARGTWRIGEPDKVLKQVAPTRLPADGLIPYRYAVFPFVFAADTWVEAVEILPENPRVLHHANVARFELGKAFSHDGFITGFVPGGDPMVLDPGTAMRIPKGSVLGLEAHYVASGRPETDRVRIGLRFPKVPVTRRAEVIVAGNTRFTIPPGAGAWRVAARRVVAGDSTVIGYCAHMHLRGRDMTFVARRPGAAPETLLMVPDYDFAWQASYRCRGDVRLPAGTLLEVFAHFDNSGFNPYNPDPTAAVRFGRQTHDEMMYGFVFVTRDGEGLALEVDPETGRELRAPK